MVKPFEQVPEEFVSKTIVCDYKTPITQISDKVGRFGAVIVQKNNEYYGMIDSRSMSSNGSRFKKSAYLDKFSDKAPVLDSSTSIGNAIAHFYYSAKKALPYTNGKRITGVVKRERILSAILSMHMLSKFSVSAALTSPVIAVDSGVNVAQAKKLMLDNKINKLPVMENGSLLGILTQRHIMPEVNLTQGRAPKMKDSLYAASNIPVGSVCERNVHTIEKDRPIDEAIRSMLENGVSSLLVIKSKAPVGIITPRDIFELAMVQTGASEDNLIISGLDSSAKEYEPEIRDAMQKLVNKVNRFHNLETHYMSINIRRQRSRTYEAKARMITTKKGAFSASVTGFSLEQSVESVLDVLYTRVKNRRDMLLSSQLKGARDIHAE